MEHTIKIGQNLSTLAECIAARKEAEEKNPGSTLTSKREKCLEYVTDGADVVTTSFRAIGMEFADPMFKNVYPRQNERFIKFYKIMEDACYSRSFSESCYSPVTIQRFIAFADAKDFEKYSLTLQNAIVEHVRQTEENNELSAEEKEDILKNLKELSFNLGYFYAASVKYNHPEEYVK